MKRILVTGNAGAGKSTVSRQISELLNIHVYGLDKIVWRSRWQRTSLSQCRSKVTRILERDQWIVDGVCLRAIKTADVIIFLDLPRYCCCWQAFKRSLRYLFKSRPDLPPRCPEILIIGYLVKLIWNFPKIVRPVLIKTLNRTGKDKTIIHIHTRQQLQQLLAALSQQHGIEASYRYKFI